MKTILRVIAIWTAQPSGTDRRRRRRVQARTSAPTAAAKRKGEVIMVTYEITTTVRADLCEAYEQYMREKHIPDLLETGAFAEASLGRSTAGRYRIWYEAHDRNALDRYLAGHVPRLRGHLLQTFPAGVDVTREEWTVLGTWSADREAEG